MAVKIGLEVVAENPVRAKRWGECGLLMNQASVDSEVRPAQSVLQKVFKERLKVLFSPQHGLFADKQDNMIESAHGFDPISGLPVCSLYSEVREPTEAMLKDIDTVLVDIQDVGTRVYTFIYTMAGIMRQCKKLGKRVVVLDRPNPIGGAAVEGNILEPESKSFVGEYPLPMRHGMTIGETALWMNEFGGIDATLEVIRMKGWRREMHWNDTGRPWIPTSPNMPTAETAELYPGMVLLEGTNLSEGRGTTLPFLMIGAPYLKELDRWLSTVHRICNLSGLSLRPSVFEPTYQKWSGTTCWGVQFVVRKFRQVESYQLGIGVILASMQVAPREFKFREPPYEYETVRQPIELLTGSSRLVAQLRSLAQSEMADSVLRDLQEEWQPSLKEFLLQRREILQYRSAVR